MEALRLNCIVDCQYDLYIMYTGTLQGNVYNSLYLIPLRSIPQHIEIELLNVGN
jgi:hypothetical protein